MDLAVITGFLGSGKTTFVLRLAEIARNKALKVAILINEVGEVGVDNQFMRRQGLNVRELIGGCICCSLASDVIMTLKEIKAFFNILRMKPAK